jgi:hypothetical protein
MVHAVDGDDISDNDTILIAVPGIPNLYLVERGEVHA